jgi:hypothetical protein
MDFHSKLAEYEKQNNATAVNILVMRELGSILVRHKKDFVDLLNGCGIPANEMMSDSELIDLYVNNIINQKLLLGTALLVNIHNKAMGADGEEEMSDEGVKMCYECMRSNFSGTGENDLQDEDYANAGGIWGNVADKALGLGKNVQEGVRNKKFGMTDSLAKRQEARQQLTESVLAEKKAQSAKSKKMNPTLKWSLIIGGSLLAVGIIGFVIYKSRKK